MTNVNTDEDCGLEELNPDLNYDGGVGVTSERWGKQNKTLENHWLLRCDFSAEIPAENTITAASLWLYNMGSSYYPGYPPSNYTFIIRRCLRAWVVTQATYNQYSTGNNWGTAGALNSSTDYSVTGAVNQVGKDTVGWWEWVITALVQDAHASRSQILNIVLHAPTADLPDASAYSYMNISSYRSITDPTNRPYLAITHTSPAGVTKTQVIWI